MARTTGRSGFKMRSSPAKGKLQDFFNTIGSQLKAGQKERGIFSEKGRAEAKEARTPKWKREYDARKLRESVKAETTEVKQTAQPPKQGPDTPAGVVVGKNKRGEWESRLPLSDDAAVVPKPKPKSSKLSAIGSEARKKQYDARGWKYDDTIKGYNRDGTKKKKKKVDLTKVKGSATYVPPKSKTKINATTGKEELDLTPVLKKSPAKIYDKKGKRRKNYKY